MLYLSHLSELKIFLCETFRGHTFISAFISDNFKRFRNIKMWGVATFIENENVSFFRKIKFGGTWGDIWVS